MANLQGRENMLMSEHGVQKPQIYGGVDRHFEGVREMVKAYSEGTFLSDLEVYDPITLTYLVPFCAAFTAIDATASAAADTLTIPLVLYKRQHWNKAESPVIPSQRRTNLPFSTTDRQPQTPLPESTSNDRSTLFSNDAKVRRVAQGKIIVKELPHLPPPQHQKTLLGD